MQRQYTGAAGKVENTQVAVYLTYATSAGHAFAAKPELARVMPAGWVTADEVDGNSPTLCGWMETRQLPYVLAVKCTEPLPLALGPPAPTARLAERSGSRLAANQRRTRCQGPALVWTEPSGAGQRRRAGGAALAAGPPQPSHGELANYARAGPASLPLVADLTRSVRA